MGHKLKEVPMAGKMQPKQECPGAVSGRVRSVLDGSKETEEKIAKFDERTIESKNPSA